MGTLTTEMKNRYNQKIEKKQQEIVGHIIISNIKE